MLFRSSELAGYIFVGNELSPITDEGEIAEVEEALDKSPNEVQQHLNRALELLSDRENPDFRNSIKESISALESNLRKKTGENTLGKALKEIQKTGIDLNPQLVSGLTSIYAWTNGKDGIRHAIIDAPNVTIEDAKLMLILNSALVNYLRSKEA